MFDVMNESTKQALGAMYVVMTIFFFSIAIIVVVVLLSALAIRLIVNSKKNKIFNEILLMIIGAYSQGDLLLIASKMSQLEHGPSLRIALLLNEHQLREFLTSSLLQMSPSEIKILHKKITEVDLEELSCTQLPEINPSLKK